MHPYIIVYLDMPSKRLTKANQQSYPNSQVSPLLLQRVTRASLYTPKSIRTVKQKYNDYLEAEACNRVENLKKRGGRGTKGKGKGKSKGKSKARELKRKKQRLLTVNKDEYDKQRYGNASNSTLFVIG